MAPTPTTPTHRFRSGLPGQYRIFWTATAVSNLGDGIRLAALPLLALQLTDDARLIAGVTAATFLPWVLIGPVAGALVDRGDRRMIMLAGQIVRGVAAIALATAVTTQHVTMPILYLAALAISCGETFVDSAAQAAVPQLVERHQLERANGQLTVAENLFNDVIGVALGAAVFAHAAGLPFYLDAATFFVGAALIATIRRPLQDDRPRSNQRLRTDIADGLRFLARHPFLRLLAGSVALTNIGLFMGLCSMVILVIKELGASKATYGGILAIGALGGVVGSVIAGRLAERFTPQRVLGLTHVPFIVGGALAAAATHTWMITTAVALSNFALVTYQIPSRTMRQLVTPDHLLGRVISAFRIFGLGGPVIGATTGGMITRALGARAAFAISVGVLAVAWLTVLRSLVHYQPSRKDAPPAMAP